MADDPAVRASGGDSQGSLTPGLGVTGRVPCALTVVDGCLRSPTVEVEPGQPASPERGSCCSAQSQWRQGATAVAALGKHR